MPIFYIKHQASSSRGVSTVIDDHQQPRYLLVGKRGLRHDVFSLYSLTGDLHGEIHQSTISPSPNFELYQNQARIGQLKKIWGVWHEFVYVKQLNWLIIGDLTQNQYRIIYHTQTIMQANSILASNGPAFQLTISQESDVVPCILIAAVLNHWAYNQPTALIRRVRPNLRFE
ncbi:LURP-one-related/scramblase family protein [Latilactobacillus graminis]|uniref:YxjI n=2 Tax=Latilactobacillus graminis TaxID=60519 RepID=A0AA89L008_9LACO|nr:hypothetical protein [Latilactobacillus graminis]KRM21161.1 hypothetical protein FC90_GL001698 [Latilactobacillus graminis DSM 20719]QFP79288.1 hypothetical protein LG542_03175 [Latilactobacillus graminis]